MAKKLKVAEVVRKMQDLTADKNEIAKYFVVDTNRSTAFGPFVTFNPQHVDIGRTPAERARSEAALPLLNAVERANRSAAFKLKLLGGYTGPIIVSEGDSWFQFPAILWDVIDNLNENYAVSSLDAAGDTMQQMLDQDEYIDEIHKENAAILVFSGGGNDVLGGGDLKRHLLPFNATLGPAQHVRSSFNALLDHTIGQYDQIYRRVAREAPGVRVVTHSYDYVVPNSDKWLGNPMEELNITDKSFQKAIAKELIDRYAAAMIKLASRHPHVSFLDNRGTVNSDEWFDELHPNNAGFKKIAASFKAKIAQIAPHARGLTATRKPGTRRLTTRAAPLNRGLSLHIGLNEIDPAHYGSKGELFGCHNDAKAMAAIAKERGYDVMGVLLDKTAKVKALRDKVKEAADTLKAGDIFLITYAGHGSQMPDFDGDEGDKIRDGGTPDGMDETWCMFDREFLDDEQYEMWTWFKDGVRILVVSDSCHSGSVIRATERGLMMIDPSNPGALSCRTRLLPRDSRVHVLTEHRAFYRIIADETAGRLKDALGGVRRRRGANGLECTVRLLSGCLDHQTSADGDVNGLFTQQLLLVFEQGFSGNYDKFHRAIRKIMPSEQTPNHMVIGRKDPGFDTQSPFEI